MLELTNNNDLEASSVGQSPCTSAGSQTFDSFFLNLELYFQ